MIPLSDRPDPFVRFAAQRAAEADPTLDVAAFVAAQSDCVGQTDLQGAGLIAKLHVLAVAKLRRILVMVKKTSARKTSQQRSTETDTEAASGFLGRKLASFRTSSATAEPNGETSPATASGEVQKDGSIVVRYLAPACRSLRRAVLRIVALLSKRLARPRRKSALSARRAS